MSNEELYNILKIKDSMIDELIKKLDNKENIIKEVREYIEKLFYFSDEDDISRKISKDIKQILDKEDKQ